MNSNFWINLFRRSSTIVRRPRQARSPATCRPQLEALEDLVLPSGTTIVPTDMLASQPIVSPQAGSSTPSGLSPAQIRQAYGFNQITFSNGTVQGTGAGETIALVDAYDDPSIATDLSVFDQQFGLSAPPSFTKVGISVSGAASTTTFPTANSGLAGEIQLEVEWAHAIAPGANILLVEANSSSDTDLLNAINYARQQSGVVAVSMSWGGSEFSGEASDDSYFTTPSGHAGVTFFGSSGDNGSPAIWPALSTHVIGVGGTSLSLNSQGNYGSESAWSGSGGGLSSYLSQPSYQQGLTIHNGTSVISANGKRSGPDVAYDANPNTGFAVYGSYGWGGWAQVGGTSDAAPQWAGLIAIVDQGRALAGLGSLDGYTQTLPDLYKLPSTDFHSVTSGSNGTYQAGAGYNLVTGLGTPIANLVVAGLVGGSSSSGGSSKPPTIATASHVVSQTSTTASLSVLGADAAGASSLTYSWTTLGTPPAPVAFSANGTNAAQNTTATFSQAGSYTLQATVTDPSGLTVTSQVTVIVSQTLTSIQVTPGSATVAPGGTSQFSATELDQFGNAMAKQPTFTWSLSSSSAGTLSSTGLFTAGSSASGSVTVKAVAGSLTGSATVTIASTSVLLQDNFSAGGGNWTITSGPYDYYLVNANGQTRLEVDNEGFTVSRVVAGQSNWTNYSYQATLNIDGSSTGSASLLARVQDNNHLYFFGYDIPMGEWIIAKKAGSTTTILAASAPYAALANTDYTVDAVVNGTSLQLYVNGVQEVATTDSSYTHGMIGFSGTDAIADLGNVIVTTVSAAQAQKQNKIALASVQFHPAATQSSTASFSQGWYGGWLGSAWQVVSSDFASFFSGPNSHHSQW